MFFGYPHGTKGCKLFDMENGKTLISRNVIFSEWMMPFKRKKSEELTAGDQNQITAELDMNRDIRPINEVNSKIRRGKNAERETEEM